MNRKRYAVWLVMQLALVGACFAASATNPETPPAATPAPAPGLADEAWRYGPWGVVVMLVVSNIKAIRSLSKAHTRTAVALGQLVEVWGTRPCLAEDKAQLREIVAKLVQEEASKDDD